MKKLISIFCAILILIGSMSMLAYAGVGDQSFRENESNNTMSSADWLYNNYTVSGTLSSEYDMDFFGFTLSSRSEVSILCQSLSSTVLVGLYDSSDEIVAAGKSSYSNGYYYDDIVTTLPAGTYYLVILQDSSYTNLSYLFYFKYSAVSSSHTHSYTKSVTDPTCTTEGLTTYTCSCGYSYKGDSIAALGHKESDWIISSQATCLAEGSRYKKCTTCGITIKTESVPKSDHTLTEWKVVGEGGCVVDGNQERTCTVCGYSETKTFSASGHSFGEYIVVKAATCTENGEKVRYCLYCGQSETVNVPSLGGHNTVAIPTVEPTCTEPGKSGGSYCNKCEIIFENPTEIPAKGHTKGQEPTVKPATVDADGEHCYLCSVCSEVIEVVAIPKIDAATIVLVTSKYVYSGGIIIPKLNIKDIEGKNITEGKDYDISTASVIKNSGKYIVKVSFKGEYDGSEELELIVAPKATSGLKSTAQTSNSITLSWSKTIGATGYEVYQYNSSTQKYEKIKTTTSTTLKVTGLKANTTYKFKVRARVKTDDGTIITGGYSSVVSAKTKVACSVKFSGSSATMYIGATKQLKATTTPADKKLTWKNSNTSVATVSSTGKVTAKKAGTATITASFKQDGETYKATYKITVKKPKVTLDKTSATLFKGDYVTLKATTTPSGLKVTWKSSNTSVATVSTSGKVTAKKAGTATITASITYKGTTYKNTCKVTVKGARKVSDVLSRPMDSINEISRFVSGYYYGACYYTGNFRLIFNSVNGVILSWGATNTSNKDIKYITFKLKYYNSVGDPAYDSITGKNSYTATLTGPIGAGKSFYLRKLIGYGDDICYGVITDMKIEYMDGTIVSGNYGYTTWHNSRTTASPNECFIIEK